MPVPASLQARSLNVYYGTQTGTATLFAERLATVARARGIETTLSDLKDCDPEDTLTHEVRATQRVVCLCVCVIETPPSFN